MRKKWENIKKTLKKKLGENRRQVVGGTGGGPYVEMKLTSIEERVLSISSSSINPLENSFDSDKMADILTKKPPAKDEEITMEVSSPPIIFKSPKKINMSPSKSSKNCLLDMRIIEHKKTCMLLDEKLEYVRLKKQKLEKEMIINSCAITKSLDA